jgi:hypothetical protein
VVKGLDVFQRWFAEHSDQYVLIGGTAATLAMEEAGLEFRATKDLDVVLHIEALTPQFGQTFWRFIEAGGYAIRQASATGKPIFYRFQKPSDTSFPAMVELFGRAPDGLEVAEGSKLTPIPLDEAVSSLSAILLDDSYYAFIMAGARDGAGLRWIGEDRLIPLKAVAWLELTARKGEGKGEAIDSKDVRKHLNDVLRLSQLLAPDTRVALPGQVAADLSRFLDALRADDSVDPKSLKLGDVTRETLAQRIAVTFGIASAE